jgi:hypothetical protein
MDLPGIGELTELDDCWRLVYEVCVHSQALARCGIEEPRDAERYIRDAFAQCLLC